MSEKNWLLATVETVNSDGLQILLRGEEKATQKKYKYVKTYTPAAGDEVCVAVIGDSYVVIGKIN